MLNISPASVTVVAAESRSILAATDQALLAHANLLAAVVQSAADLPVHLTQDIYVQIQAHGSKLVEGRGELRNLITKLTAVKNRSNQSEIALGCPAGAPGKAVEFFTDAHLAQEAQPA